MGGFLKLTKAKVLLTILLFLLALLYFSGLSSYGSSLPDLCLPRIPDTSGNSIQISIPTPAPLSIPQTVADLKNPSCLGNYPNDPSAQVAIAIMHTTNVLIITLPILLLSYLLSCFIVFFAVKLKKQKKQHPTISKKRKSI